MICVLCFLSIFFSVLYGKVEYSTILYVLDQYSRQSWYCCCLGQTGLSSLALALSISANQAQFYYYYYYYYYFMPWHHSKDKNKCVCVCECLCACVIIVFYPKLLTKTKNSINPRQRTHGSKITIPFSRGLDASTYIWLNLYYIYLVLHSFVYPCVYLTIHVNHD